MKLFPATFTLLLCAVLLCNGANHATAQDNADANSDGKITTDELKAFLTDKYVKAWVKKIDANGNGKISKYEMRLIQKALTKVIEEEVEAEAVDAKKMENVSSIDRMNNGFLKRKPLIGSTVDELTAIDEDGEEIEFSSFQGKHVVLVFGCLT